jgi:ribosome modulation factor
MLLSISPHTMAERKYPNSAALRGSYVRGAMAGQLSQSDETNPYSKKFPATGFIAAHRNAWFEGWRDAVQVRVYHADDEADDDDQCRPSICGYARAVRRALEG